MNPVFTHVRIIIGIVLGLGLTHLLRQAVRMVEHPRRNRVWWVHLVWAFAVFVYLIHFWWWEFRLDTITHWNFSTYLFLLLYTILLYLLCALLFPEDISDYDDWKAYFLSRRGWIFGVLATVYAFDVVDTWLKGASYAHALGAEYIARSIVFVILSLIAMRTRKTAFHATFAILGLLYEATYIVRLYYGG